MSLILDKDTAQQFVRISFINDTSNLPDFELAAQRYLVPIIGASMYEDLVSQVESIITDDVLVKKCRAVVAPLAYLMDLPTIHAQITDAGIRTINTENLQAAHRWEYNEVKESLADKGAYAIEDLIKHLFENADDYSDWTESAEYEEINRLIFKSGVSFNKYFRVLHPYRVWWQLRPLIAEVEEFSIEPTIGKSFLQELKEVDDPNPAEAEAIDLIRKAVAQYTIVKAIEKLTVKITPQGFTVLLNASSADAANAGSTPAPDHQLSMLHESCKKSGDSYIVKLKEFLDQNASATVFETYFESEYYEAPEEDEPESRNANRKIFGL